MAAMHCILFKRFEKGIRRVHLAMIRPDQQPTPCDTMFSSIEEIKTTTGGSFRVQTIHTCTRIAAERNRRDTHIARLQINSGWKRNKLKSCAAENEESSAKSKRLYSSAKGSPRKTPATQEQLQNNRIVDLEMKVELLQNFLSECGRM